MIAYKLVRQMKDGSLSPLFINCRSRLEYNKWLIAGCFPTKGFALRPGWHCTFKPNAPHLSPKKRVWIEVEIKDFKKHKRPVSQGGMWYLAEKMKVLRILTPKEVTELKEIL